MDTKAHFCQKCWLFFFHCSQCLPGIFSFKIIVCLHSFFLIHVNATTNLQSLMYICLVISVCVKQRSEFICGNSLLRVKTLTCYLHRTMYTWVKFEKAIAAWPHRISTKRIQTPGCTPFLIIHHPPTLEASINPTKSSCSSKTFAQLYSLTLYLLHNIGMWHAGLIHHNKLKPLLAQLTQHNPVLRASTSYKLKYDPFTNTCITVSSNMIGRIYALSLTNPIMTADG